MADRQELVSIQTMMGTPVVTKKSMEKGSDTMPILFSDTIVRINGYNCLLVEFENEDEMVRSVPFVGTAHSERCTAIPQKGDFL